MLYFGKQYIAEKMTLRRILKEYHDLIENDCCIVFENDDTYRWKLNTAINTSHFPTPIQITISVHFPTDYPFKPPKLTLIEATSSVVFLKDNRVFNSALYHDRILNHHWGPHLCIRSILQRITSWLNYFDGDITKYNERVDVAENELCICRKSVHLQPCECVHCKPPTTSTEKFICM